MSDDIPQDVWDAAEKANGQARVMSVIDQQVEIVARAVLAERERCAKIADTYEAIWKRAVAPVEDGAVHRQSAGRDIAYAIRAGDQPLSGDSNGG